MNQAAILINGLIDPGYLEIIISNLLSSNKNISLWIQKDIVTLNLTWFTSINNALVLVPKVTVLSEYVELLTMVKSVWLIRVLILYHVLQYCLTMKKDKQYRHVTLSLLTFIYSSLHFPKHHLYTSIMFFMVRVNTKKIKIILYIRYKCISSRSLYG